MTTSYRYGASPFCDTAGLVFSRGAEDFGACTGQPLSAALAHPHTFRNLQRGHENNENSEDKGVEIMVKEEEMKEIEVKKKKEEEEEKQDGAWDESGRRKVEHITEFRMKFAWEIHV